MFDYSRNYILAESKKRNFNTNTFEKVLRLTEVLKKISNSEYKDKLLLKGGTAINLWLLNLPRLSVDADFDYCGYLPKEEMLIEREKINNYILKLMELEGYKLNSRSKFTHSLDSFVYGYTTLSNSNDVLKIEINYSNRLHVNEAVISDMATDLCDNFMINRLSNDELIGSKINALIARTTPRDVYDVYEIINEYKVDYNHVKKIAIFYLALGNELPIDISGMLKTAKDKIKSLDYNKIRESLIPLLPKGKKIDINMITGCVISMLDNEFILTENEKEFTNQFNKGIYNQELLFEDYKVNDMSKHPMVIWKIMNINK